MTPLELQRLAVRIETLQRAKTHDWHPGDDLEFRNMLPGGRGSRVLPDPKRLRELADSFPLEEEDRRWVQAHWRDWLSFALRAEGLVRDNDPRNPKKTMRDIMRGRWPRR